MTLASHINNIPLDVAQIGTDIASMHPQTEPPVQTPTDDDADKRGEQCSTDLANILQEDSECIRYSPDFTWNGCVLRHWELLSDVHSSVDAMDDCFDVERFQ